MSIGPVDGPAGVFLVNRAEMDRFISWAGPIGSDLRRRGRTLEFRGRMSAGVRSGKLRLDIETREATRVDGLEISVGSWHTPWAAAHHEGSGPHEIVARNAPMLQFYWAKKARWVSTKRVWHPGTKANPYLTRWLREAVS